MLKNKTKQIRIFFLRENQKILKKWKKDHSAIDIQYHFNFIVDAIKNNTNILRYIDQEYFTRDLNENRKNYTYITCNETTYDKYHSLNKVERLYFSQLLTIRVLKTHG